MQTNHMVKSQGDLRQGNLGMSDTSLAPPCNAFLQTNERNRSVEH